MRILFLSTLNLATNPRFFKEIKLAISKGFEVEVVCFEFDNWSYEFNQELKKQISAASIHIIPAGRNPFLPWAKSVWFERFYRELGKYFKLSLSQQSSGVSRRSKLLVNTIQQLKGPYDLIIGHNPGALYPTYFAAKKFNAKAGFDVEDYHPGEGSNLKEQALTYAVMNELLPKMDYVSFAAPLIKEKHVQDCGKESENWISILNYFSKEDFKKKHGTSQGKLKVVWFSQNINYKRGLEQIIPALDNYKETIELSLIGNCKETFAKEYLSPRNYIKIYPPQDQKKLHQLMNHFDVGLAIEPGKDGNNFIVLANKLMTYFQSGLYILASDTPAHKTFFNDHPINGKVFSLTNENVYKALDFLVLNSAVIKEEHEKRFEEGKQNNWESESEKLHNCWKLITS